MMTTMTRMQTSLRFLVLAAGSLLCALPARAQMACESPVADLAQCPPCPASPRCRSPKPGFMPPKNGCGPAKFSNLIERGVIPQGYGDADFANGGCPASQNCGCNLHDVCYSTCNSSKMSCDTKFQDDMRNECFKKYPVVRGERCDDFTPCNRDRLGICLSRARLYFRLVSGSAGQGPYEDAQKEACQCCGPASKVWCFCNKKCYDSGTACLAECKVGLGCFTGICQPATPELCPPE